MNAYGYAALNFHRRDGDVISQSLFLVSLLLSFWSVKFSIYICWEIYIKLFENTTFLTRCINY